MTEQKIEPILFLKKDECIPIMRKAWIEKRLGMFHGFPGGTNRQGPNKEYCCIIASCVPDNLIGDEADRTVDETDIEYTIRTKTLPNGCGVLIMKASKLFAFDDSSWFGRMQGIYDSGGMEVIADVLGLEGDDRYGY